MNGRDLTLSLVAGLAVGAALGRRGSRSVPLATVLQEEVQPGFWVRVRRTADGRHLQALLLLTPHAVVYDEEDNEVYGFVLADDARVYLNVLPYCSAALDEARTFYGVQGLYIVGNTALDDAFQGRGIGLAMYDALVRAAWQERYAVSPHWCAPRGSVTSDAMRVWAKLARRYPHVGDPDYMRAEEDDRNPEALAQAGTPVIVWGGDGSHNRATAPRWNPGPLPRRSRAPERVPLDTIRSFDFDKIDPDTDKPIYGPEVHAYIDALAQSFRRNQPVPPVEGFRGRDGRVWIEDGNHRIEAARRAGLREGLVWMRAPEGEFNRAPAPTDAALRALRATMAKAARADTAFAPAKWTRAKDPLTGHCYAVAHVVRERFGGELVKGTVQGQAHAWNRLPGGREVDLSGSQYGGDGLHPVGTGEVAPWPKSVNPRFARFAERVDRQLALR